MLEQPTVTIIEKRKIFKYAEGVDPTTGTPFEVSEVEVVHTGDDALNILKQINPQ